MKWLLHSNRVSHPYKRITSSRKHVDDTLATGNLSRYVPIEPSG